VTHYKATQDFSKGLLRSASYYQKEVRGEDHSGQQTHGSPTYTGVMLHVHKKNLEVMEFFFCNDDIERCVKSTKQKWVQSRPDIPSIWLVKIETNFSTKKILDLESAGFQ
jgi:hypothetical protein